MYAEILMVSEAVQTGRICNAGTTPDDFQRDRLCEMFPVVATGASPREGASRLDFGCI